MNNIEAQNNGVKQWSGQSLQEIKTQYLSVVRGSKRTGDGLDSLKIYTKKSFGEINQISFGFNRYLVWLIKGAGKGQGGSKGSSWLNSSGQRITTNRKSFGKMNSGKRISKDFMNPVLDSQLPKLADIVASFKADQVIKSIQIK